jgi:predicted nucleic acid-binding protein
VEPSLEEALGPGKAAAITLAELLGASVLLIDERKGRAVARDRA